MRSGYTIGSWGISVNVTLPPSAVRDRSDVRAESGKSKNTGDQPAYISNVAVIYPVFFLLYLVLLKPYFLNWFCMKAMKPFRRDLCRLFLPPLDGA